MTDWRTPYERAREAAMRPDAIAQELRAASARLREELKRGKARRAYWSAFSLAREAAGILSREQYHAAVVALLDACEAEGVTQAEAIKEGR